jgi:type I restriction enzyme, S subunit
MASDGWHDMALGEFITLQRGHDLTASERRPGTIPVMGSAGIAGYHDTSLAKGPGVTIGRSGVGSMGVASYSPVDYWPHNTVLYVTDFRGNDERFTYYFLHHLDLRRFNSGSAQASLNRNFIYPLRILVPGPREQKAIAHVLGTLDDKIDLNRRMSRTLERVARAIFRAWFVDFEPVKAKAAGANSFPGMPQEAFDTLPARLVESGLGPIPKGWGVGRLGENCEINALNLKKADIEGEIEYIDISSVTVGRLDAVQIVPYTDAPSRARRRVRHGDTIWSCVRPNHRSYLFIHTPPDNLIVSTGFTVLSPRNFGPSLLHQLTIQPEFVDYLVSNADGSAYPAVRPDHFAAAEVIVPPSSLREAFEAITMPCRDLVASSDRECAKLAALRDYLLPKLLRGEVRVAADSVCSILETTAASRERRLGHA